MKYGDVEEVVGTRTFNIPATIFYNPLTEREDLSSPMIYNEKFGAYIDRDGCRISADDYIKYAVAKHKQKENEKNKAK